MRVSGKPGIRYMVQRVAVVTALAAAAGCAADSDRAADDRKPEAPASAAEASIAVPPAAEPNAGMVAHAPHFEPASRHLPPLAAVAARLPANAEDTGRYNARKPKEVIVNPPPLPQGPLDTQLRRRQDDYLARWHAQEAAMAGASAEAVEQARAELKAKVVGQ
jgi:hypothetical protein